MKKIVQITIQIVLILFYSCATKTTFNSTSEKIKSFEKRARTYQALADAQRLSSPYNDRYFRNQGINNPAMRIAYLKEAERYRKLAEQARMNTESKKKLE